MLGQSDFWESSEEPAALRKIPRRDWPMAFFFPSTKRKGLVGMETIEMYGDVAKVKRLWMRGLELMLMKFYLRLGL